MAATNVQTLNQYSGSDSTGKAMTIVAPDMETACKVYADTNTAEPDPTIMQVMAKGISCVLPTVFVTFTTEVKADTAINTTAAIAAGCRATPRNYTLLAGTKQIFTADAGTGWTFKEWDVDGAISTEADATKPVAVLTIPQSPTQITISAVFAKNP